MDMGKDEKAPLLKRLERRNWIILAAMLTLSLPFLSFQFSLGIVTGGVLSILSFQWLYRILKRAIVKPAGLAKATVILWYYVRLSSIGIVLYIVISNRMVDLIALIIGLSIVVLNIIFTTIKDYRRILLEV